MEWHPDRQPPEKREEAQKRFSQVANAYETLSDPNKRQMYDLGGGMGQSGPSAALSEEWSWWSEHIDDT
eukprot:g29941.t1